MHPRIDTDRIRRDHPITTVVASYGIDLRHAGRALVGRCPLHHDGGRPNLHLYPDSESWYCYRCSVGGDVIAFVMRVEGLGFRAAVARLKGAGAPVLTAPIRPHRIPHPDRSRRGWDAAERACLAAAVALYSNCLLGEPAACGYLASRGIEPATVERCRLGYASGDELVPYLRWRRLPVHAALRVGLLDRDGRERLAGRIVVPEIRHGQPIWLIGRALTDDDGQPKYLGLPGPKPLLGWETAARSTSVVLVEGVFDWLVLVQWRIPAVALLGTVVRGEALDALDRFARLAVALDNDPSGREATRRLVDHFGPRAVPAIVPGVKDVAELAIRPDGQATFAGALGRTLTLPVPLAQAA